MGNLSEINDNSSILCIYFSHILVIGIDMCFSAVASFSSGAILAAFGFCLLRLNCLDLSSLIKLFDFLQNRFQKPNNNSNTRSAVSPFREYNSFSDEEKAEFDRERLFWWPILLTPILFATQQYSEGVVWITLDKNKENGDYSAAFIFSFFAFCFWPLWVPFVCFVVEYRGVNRITNQQNKTEWLQARLSILFFLLLGGIGLFIYTMNSIISSGLTNSEENNHIVYRFTLMDPANVGPIAMLVPYLVCTIFPFLLVMSVKSSWIMTAAVGIAAIVSIAIYSEGSFPSTWCFFAAWLSLILCFLRIQNIIQTISFQDIQVC